MNTCVIFCAGGFEKLAQPLDHTDLVIAADGGLRHLEKLGLAPHVVLGDFDSLGYIPKGAEVYPVEKDDTDSMLAVRCGLKRGYTRFVLYGALDGDRLDHTIANLQTLCYLQAHGATGYLAGLTYMATAVSRGRIGFSSGAAGTVSLFCFGEDACVTLRGLKYAVEDCTITSAFPLGVSNRFLGQPASIAVSRGCCVVLYDVTNGFPETEEAYA